MQHTRDNQKAMIVKKLAAKHNVGTNEIYKILRGDRDNDAVLADYIEMRDAIQESIEKVQRNPLMQAVRSLDL